MKELLEKNLYLDKFIDQQTKEYLHGQFSDKAHKEPSNSTSVSYYKLSYIANLSTELKPKVFKYCKYYCENTNI